MFSKISSIKPNTDIHYAALVWRIGLCLSYRPMPPIDEAELPTVSVIIPAYNEGALVRKAIDSVTHSDYPQHKFQVIAVDDGSSDNTWEHILAAAADSPMKVITLRQPANQGKRHARPGISFLLSVHRRGLG